MIKKVQKHNLHVCQFQYNINSHAPQHQYFTSVETRFIQHCVYQIYQKIHFFNTVQNSRLRKNKIIHYVKTKQT